MDGAVRRAVSTALHGVVLVALAVALALTAMHEEHAKGDVKETLPARRSELLLSSTAATLQADRLDAGPWIVNVHILASPGEKRSVFEMRSSNAISDRSFDITYISLQMLQLSVQMVGKIEFMWK